MATMIQWCAAVAKRVATTTKMTSSFRSYSSFSPSLSSSTVSASSSAAGGAVGLPVVCGRGDKKTKRGKRFKGSFGKSRPKRDKLRERFKDKIEVPRSTPWPLPFKLI